LTRKGLKQIEIARRFACGVDAVRAIQQAANVLRWRELTPEVERECVALLRLGHGQYPVAKMCRVSQRKIHALMNKYRIHHAAGGSGLPAAKHARIFERVRRREDFGTGIGRKEGVSRSTVLDVAHKIYGPGRFTSHGQPLTSAQNTDVNVERNTEKFLSSLVRKQVAAEASTMHYEKIWRQIVEGYLEREYAGVLPPDRAAFLSEIVSLAFPECWPEILPLKSEVAGYLKLAVDAIASKQDVVN
jgi:hypothetical protein